MVTFLRSYRRKPPCSPVRTGEPAKAPAWIFERRLGGGDGAVLLGADLDLDCARPRSVRSPEHFLAGHHHLHRTAAFLRERQRHRLEIDQRLAAEAAADLRRGHADVGHVDPQQLRDIGANHELALAAAPDLRLAVARRGGDAGMRLDIALMHGLGGVVALDDHLGVLEAQRDVAQREDRASWRCWRAWSARAGRLGDHTRCRIGASGRHRRLDVDDMRQHLVIDLDERSAFSAIAAVVAATAATA